jgi:anti-sigma-K factor RskA
MNDLTCAEIADLLPAYVLDAMDGDERCALLEHLAECRLHDADLQTERSMALALAEAVPPVAPPTTLRSSLLDAFDKAVAGDVPRAAQPEPVRLEPRRRSFLEVLRAPSFAYGLAAAVLVLAVALGAWGVSRGGGDDGGVRLASAREFGNRLDVTYMPGKDLAVLAYDLPAVERGKTYQAWQIVDGKPVSLGVLDRNSGAVTIAANLDRAQAVAISVEPEGGSTTPTTVAIASPFS